MRYNKWTGLTQQSRSGELDYPPKDGVISCGNETPRPKSYFWESYDMSPTYDESVFFELPEKSVDSYVKRPPDDNQSFKKIRESGIIKMTDYSRGKTEKEYYLTGNLPYAGGARLTYAGRSCRQQNGDILYNSINPVWLYSTCSRRYSLADPYITGLPHYEASDVDLGLESRISSVKSEVVADTLATVDLLTELAEARKSIQLVLTAVRAVKRPLQTFERMKKEILAAKKAGNIQAYKRRQAAYANAWMQGRYGIMPLIYSVQDAVELYEDAKLKYMTKRAGDGFTKTGSTKPLFVNDDTGNFLYDTYDYTYSIRGTGKVAYDLPALRVADQTGFNFATTAWELFPASFVADWFANIGEWAAAQTSTMVDLSSQRKFCYSVKTESTIVTSLSIAQKLEASKTIDTGYPGLDGTWPLEVNNGRIDQDLRRVIVEDYERIVFSPTDVELHWNPDLTDWRKWVDLMSISLNSGSRALRNLRL
jgi:hypothetical protein